MEGLDIFPPTAPTLNKMRMKKNKLQNSEEVNQEARKNPMGARKIFMPWKTVKIQMKVKLKKLKSYLWV